MARPRIFISSTYFDLRVIRADLNRFIMEIGYDPVLFERGQIPYNKDNPLEDSCYREINSCDILIAIIGGKYGTQSSDQKHSITQRELKTALDLGKQIYVFVEKAVHNEYTTYQLNKNVQGFKPASVSDIKVFGILEEIHSLPAGNPIQPFELSEDIIHFLKEQWAGLFQRLLQESARQKEINIIEGLKDTATTLKQLVTFLTEQRTKGDNAIKDILLSSHPAFAQIKNIVGIQYRVVFHTVKELDYLLTARSFKQDTSPASDDFYEWDNEKSEYGIRVSKSIFDKQGNLRTYTPQDWNDKWIIRYEYSSDNDFGNEVPF